MNVPSRSPRNDPPSRSRRAPRWPQFLKIICAVAALWFVGDVGLASIPRLRAAKFRLTILRNQVEEAAAPGEPVLVKDAVLYQALLWRASPPLADQLLRTQHGEAPKPRRSELIVVATEADPLLADLRAQGFVLRPHLSQTATVAGGRGFHKPGKPDFRIYFAVRP